MPPAPGLELGVPAPDDSGDDGDGLQIDHQRRLRARRRVDPPPPPQLATTLTTVTPCRVVDTIAFRPGVTRANNAILGVFGSPAGNVAVASGFAVGTPDLVIDVTGWWR